MSAQIKILRLRAKLSWCWMGTHHAQVTHNTCWSLERENETVFHIINAMASMTPNNDPYLVRYCMWVGSIVVF